LHSLLCRLERIPVHTRASLHQDSHAGYLCGDRVFVRASVASSNLSVCTSHAILVLLLLRVGVSLFLGSGVCELIVSFDIVTSHWSAQKRNTIATSVLSFRNMVDSQLAAIFKFMSDVTSLRCVVIGICSCHIMAQHHCDDSLRVRLICFAFGCEIDGLDICCDVM